MVLLFLKFFDRDKDSYFVVSATFRIQKREVG